MLVKIRLVPGIHGRSSGSGHVVLLTEFGKQPACIIIPICVVRPIELEGLFLVFKINLGEAIHLLLTDE